MQDFIIENNTLKSTCKELELKSYNLGQHILDVLSSQPNHIAQIDADTGKTTTFAEMKDRSIRCALWLKEQGIGPGDIVTTCTHKHEDAYIPILASFYVGAIYNAWSDNVALKPIQSLIDLLRPKVIFATEQTVGVISEAVELEANFNTKIIVFDQSSNYQSLKEVIYSYDIDSVNNFVPQNVEPNEIAYIALSSGSTGSNKGVMFSYRSLLENCYFNFEDFKNLVGLCYSPQYWLSALRFTINAIFNSTTQIIHKKFDVVNTSRIIEKYKVQYLFSGPSDITYLCKSDALKKYNFSSLKYILIFGSKINPNIAEEFKNNLSNTSVCVAYGMTETGRGITCQTLNAKNNSSVGFITAYTQLKIVDLTTKETLGSNETGEIHIKLSSSMTGYYKNPTMTKEVKDEEGWIHSGDIGYYDENGEIYIVDRIKDVMKFRNHQIPPSEIEEIILSHADVIEVGVTSIPNDFDGEWPIAFVKKAPKAKVTEEELVKMSTLLGEHKMLRGGVIFLDELPKTDNGKLMRPKLKEMAKTLLNNEEQTVLLKGKTKEIKMGNQTFEQCIH